MYSEINQACRWNQHPIYQAVMTMHDQEDIYVHDFVMYSHSTAGSAIGRIEKLYVNVSFMRIEIYIISQHCVIQGPR